MTKVGTSKERVNIEGSFNMYMYHLMLFQMPLIVRSGIHMLVPSLYRQHFRPKRKRNGREAAV